MPVMEISVHDNLLTSYTVDAENRQICLRTKYPYGEEEKTEIIFSGVFTYYFEADNLQTIIFDVEESTLEVTYEQYQSLFGRLKNYGWPSTQPYSKEELFAMLRGQGVKAFEISSSFGLVGFVWAVSMEKRPE